MASAAVAAGASVARQTIPESVRGQGTTLVRVESAAEAWQRPLTHTYTAVHSLGSEVYVTTISEIEEAIRRLSRADLAAFREWFDRFDAEAWDRQFEQDAREGRLDDLANEALKDLREGRCTDL